MAKDRMLYMKLCFVVIVFGLSFIICNKHSLLSNKIGQFDL